VYVWRVVWLSAVIAILRDHGIDGLDPA